MKMILQATASPQLSTSSSNLRSDGFPRMGYFIPGRNGTRPGTFAGLFVFRRVRLLVDYADARCFIKVFVDF